MHLCALDDLRQLFLRCAALGSCGDALINGQLELREPGIGPVRSEEHTSELQSLMRISYAVFCLKKQISLQHSPLPKSSTKNQAFPINHTHKTNACTPILKSHIIFTYRNVIHIKML